jgi:fatty-acyl-CoA synthase
MANALVSWLEFHAGWHPDRTATVDLATGRRLSYRELSGRVRAIAHALAGLGVGRGDRVAVLSRNDVRTFEVLYACAHLGAICVLLNWRLAEPELAEITLDAEPAVLIAESHVAELADRLAKGLVSGPADTARTPHRITWASEAGEPDDYEQLAIAAPPADWAPADVDVDSPWTILYTSGTTGRPKGVLATHRNLHASMLGIALAGGIDASSRCLTVLPTFHVAGLGLFANPVLLMGGTVVVMRQFDPAAALELLRTPESGTGSDTDGDTGRITHFTGVPANFQFMAQLPEFDSARFDRVTSAVGGAPVPHSLIETWSARGMTMMTVYGITEAGATVIAVPPGRALAKNGTIGLPLLHARCRVRRVDDAPVGAGEVGELRIRGDLVTPGYWRRPEATAAAFDAEGWFRTGDAARVDEDGYLVLVDRWKDMYISGGENVYPAEVENVLYAHPEVSQAAVVGVPDERWGETGVAFVVAAPGTDPEATQLRTWCAERIARYKVPSRVLLVDELPRNATGKVVKPVLREQLGG